MAVAAKMTIWNRRSFLGAIIWNEILIETDIDIELAKDLLKTFGGEMPYPDQLPEWAMQELVSSFKFFATVTTSHFRKLSLNYFSRTLAKSDPLALLQFTDENQRHKTGLA